MEETVTPEVSKEEEERRLRLKRKVQDEIINSEASYIAQLELLLNVSYCTCRLFWILT